MQDMQPLDNQEPISAPAPAMETDHEGAMAKADLYKLANYSLKLFKQINDGDQLEAWVQAKITKAADYIASVYHYLEYEMKFSEYGAKLENSDVYSESQKVELKNKLMEAKEKIKALKVTQAEKVAPVSEGILSGGERACTECGGTGVVYEEPKEIPAHVKSKVEKYKRLTKATHAAHKRLDRNNNGIPDNLEDDKEVEEDQSNLKKAGDSYKTAAGGTVTKTATGVKHERDPNSYDDGSDSEEKSGKGTKSHAKAMSAAEKKERAPKLKQSPKSAKTWGMKDGEKFDNRDKEKAVDEMYGQGVYEGKKAKKDYDKDGKVESEKDEVWGSRMKAAKKAGKMEEGKDEGKPGKNSAKIAKKAGEKYGSKEAGERVAGAVRAKLAKAGKLEETDKGDMDHDGRNEPDSKEYMDNKDAAIKKAMGKKDVKTDEGTMPQDLDGSTAPPPKGKDGQYPIITSGPNKGKRWSPQTPGPTNPALKESEVIAESAEIARLKELTQKLLG